MLVMQKRINWLAHVISWFTTTVATMITERTVEGNFAFTSGQIGWGYILKGKLLGWGANDSYVTKCMQTMIAAKMSTLTMIEVRT